MEEAIKTKLRIIKKVALLTMGVAVAVVSGFSPVRADASEPVCRIDNTTYTSLEQAVNAVRNNNGGIGTVTLLTDTQLHHTLDMKGLQVTFESEDPENPYTIRKSSDYTPMDMGEKNTDSMFYVSGPETLLHLSNIILDGGAAWDDINDDGSYKNSGVKSRNAAIYIEESAKLILNDGTIIRNNDASPEAGISNREYKTGGAIYADNANIFLQDCALTANQAGDGGGLYASNSRLVIGNLLLEENHALKNGGGLLAENGSTIANTGKLEASNNSAGKNGGALCFINAAADFSAPVIVKRNTASAGGGISLIDCPSIILRNATISENIADFGAAIELHRENAEKQTVLIDGLSADNNYACQSGAVLYTENAGDVTMQGTIDIRNNTAEKENCDIGCKDPLEVIDMENAIFVNPITFRCSQTTAGITETNAIPDKESFPLLLMAENGTESEKAMELYSVPEQTPQNIENPLTITYDANGATSGTAPVDNNRYEIGGHAFIKENTGMLEREGYLFEGWNTSPDGWGADYYAGGETYLNESLKLYARWGERGIIPEYTVTYEYNGGTGTREKDTVLNGVTIALPVPEKEGNTFKGWYEDPEMMNKFIGTARDNYVVIANRTLYAKWEKSVEKPEEEYCTITFNPAGGSCPVSEKRLQIGEKLSLPAAEKEGYLFTGWYFTRDGENICAGLAGEMVSFNADTTLMAHYEKHTDNSYSVKFDANGGKSSVNNISVKGKQFITLPEAKREGYTFLGWYSAKENGTLMGLTGDEYYVTENTTLFAAWEKEGNSGSNMETCIVTFHPNGGNLTRETVNVIKGSRMMLPNVVKDGYIFKGWYLDSDCKNLAGTYKETYRINKDMQFYAAWEKKNGQDEDKNNSAAYFTITYDANGGKATISVQKVAKQGSVILPAVSREGCIFQGWYTKEQVFIGMDGEAYKPSRDIALIARWKNEAGKETEEESVPSYNEDSSKEDNTVEDMDNYQDEYIQTGYPSYRPVVIALCFITFAGAAAILIIGRNKRK